MNFSRQDFKVAYNKVDILSDFITFQFLRKFNELPLIGIQVMNCERKTSPK